MKVYALKHIGGKRDVGFVSVEHHMGNTDKETIAELTDAWRAFYLQDQNYGDPESIEDFAEWFNDNYTARIEVHKIKHTPIKLL